MRVHQVVLEHLNKEILPYVFQVQDGGVPYPAELWEGENCKSETGSLMINIEENRLVAEYFAYDIKEPYRWVTAGFDDDTQWKLVLKETRVEIPVDWIQESRKARTIYSGVRMPRLRPYTCNIQGWLGDPGTEMSSAVITITDLPNLHMPQGSLHLPEETLGDSLTHIRTETRTPVLTLESEDWKIDIKEIVSNPSEETGSLHTATLRKTDGSPFTLSAEEGIIVALRQFLSFQTGGWINVPTIVSRPIDSTDWVKRRALVGKLTSRSVQHRSQGTAADFRDWPGLFKEFWKSCKRNPRHLNNAIHHYVSCSEIFENSYGIHYATVAARSTLESLVRWWNNLAEEYEFQGNSEHQLPSQLLKAIEAAELGRDADRRIDKSQVKSVISRASQFRNQIDHGRAGNVDAYEMRKIIAHQQYMHNLARLLILAKLGMRNTDARGSFFSPEFMEAQP